MDTTSSTDDTFQCPVCERECDGEDRSHHHVLPKSRGGKTTETICRACHRQIHRLFTVKELARDYSTIEALRVAPAMQTWIAWVSKRPARRMRRTEVY
jgi:hypothetical protein